MQRSIYSPIILTHYRNPQNFGKLNKPTHTAEERNPLCGDEVKVYLTAKHGRIKDIAYEARGCALSIAAASVLSERIRNQESGMMGLEKINKSDIEKMLGIKVSPARESCITLALKAIKKTL